MQHSDCWISLAVFCFQMLGLASIALARVQLPSLRHDLCQRTFLGYWLLMGGATITALACGSGCWVSCGTIFSVMAVGATFDVGNSVPANSF